MLDGHRGGMHSTGAGSSVTGRGADLLIIDDPIKNSDEAKSLVRRNNLWDWFNTTAMTRLEPNAAVVLLMTRWHRDDLCGRLLDSENYIPYSEFQSGTSSGKRWVHLPLPAIAGDNDILGRNPGEALWNERYLIEQLEDNKMQMGSYWFEAMYQQEPVREEDAMFKKEDFRYFSEQGDFYILSNDNSTRQSIYKPDCIIMASADLAVSTKETADYTAIIVFAVTPDFQILILDVYRHRVNGRAVINLFESVRQRWEPRIWGVESVHFQNVVIDQLSDRGLNVKRLSPNGKDKRTRAQGIALRLENHSVFFRAGAEWLPEFEKELLHFPGGTHDDQCDAFAYIDFLIHKRSTALPTGISNRKNITMGY